MNFFALLARMVVEKPHDVILQVRVAANLPVYGFTAVSSADDKKMISVLPPMGYEAFQSGAKGHLGIGFFGQLEEKADEKPYTANKKDRQEPVDNEGTSGKAHETGGKQNARENHQGTHSGGFYDVDQIPNASETPHPSVKVEKMKNG
jgi:hypothetical protein